MIDILATRVATYKSNARFTELVNRQAVQYLMLTVITLLAFAMRFYKLGEWSFWIDEIFTINHTNMVMRERILSAPLSIWLTAGSLELFGTHHWSARLAPALIGILTIPSLYFPVKKLFGAGVALLAMFLLAISPWHLHWSQNARFYTALVLFYTLALVAFYFWLEQDRIRYLVISGVFLFLAVQERSMALFIVPVIVIYAGLLLILPFGMPKGLRWRNILLLGIPGFLFALYLIFGTNLIQGFVLNIFGRQHNPLRILLSFIYDIGLPLFLISLLGGIYLVLQKSRAGLYLLLGAVVPLALLVVISPFTQAFSRYIFITLPNFAILGAAAANEILVQTQRHTRILAAGILILLAADAFSQDFLYYNFQNGNREDWKNAFTLVQKEKADGDQFVSTRVELGEYYLDQEVIDATHLDPKVITASGKRTWLVIDNRSSYPNKLEKWIAENTELVGVHDVYLPGKTFMMRVYLYDPENH